MRRWPSWLLRMLIPVLLIGIVVGIAIFQTVPSVLVWVLGIVVSVFAATVVAGCFMVLSDRRHGRTATTSVAYRAPGYGRYEILKSDAAVRYGLWKWVLGDPPQDPCAPEHEFTPKQREIDRSVTGIALIFFVVLEIGLIVFAVILTTVNMWWGTPNQWGPLITSIVMVGLLIAEFIAVGISIAANRDSTRH